jgi:hypothetical protein
MKLLKRNREFKIFNLTIVLIFIQLILFSCRNNSENNQIKNINNADLKNISYLIGWQLGKLALCDSINLDKNYLSMGLKQGLRGDSSFLNKEETEQSILILNENIKLRESKEIFKIIFSHDSITKR